MREGLLRTLLTWTFRTLLGAVFLFSGFVKAVDPWGTYYKFHDYFAAMGITVMDSMTLALVFILCGAEFLLGVFFLFGCYRRHAGWLGLLFMAVMLPLTFWLAWREPIQDCGCFGDAVILTNWETFWKNVALTALCIWMIPYGRTIHWLITPALQWLACVASGVFIFLVALIGYDMQPVIDFRPYPVGGTMLKGDTTAHDADDYVFIYRKDGQEHEFTIQDSLPSEDDGWEYVDTRQLASAGPQKEEDGIHIYESDGSDEDVTEAVLGDGRPQVIVFFPQLTEATIASSYKVNSLADWCESHGVGFLSVANSTPEEVDDWRDLSLAEYPVYLAEDTSIKEVVRGNPAVVYMHGGKIVWKCALEAFRLNDFMTEETETSAETLNPLLRYSFTWLWAAYCIAMGSLMLISFTPGFWSGIRRRILRRRQRLRRARLRRSSPKIKN